MSKRTFLRKVVVSTVILLIIGIIALAKIVDYQISQPLNLTENELLTLSSGTSFNQFTRQLVKLGAIDSKIWLKSYVKVFPEKGKIKAGTYQLTPQMSAKEVLALLCSGKEYQFSITFIEGSTFKEWLAIIKEHPHILHTLTTSDYGSVSSLLALDKPYPEGLFFPDTYLFTEKTSDIEILKRAYEKMKTLLAQEWEARDENLPYDSAYQALIMASIIEKESGQLAEHQIIASVFVNRLRKNMRLQTDPTVIYGLGERYKGDIKRVHLKEKTAYNTYRINGLPPTPIAMPGKSAIYAAMHPELTDYYYFVSQGNGKHIFSTNLKEHNQAVTKYILNN
ncbi:endolytic transglycosylase MltG [Thalassotalea piscium]